MKVLLKNYIENGSKQNVVFAVIKNGQGSKLSFVFELHLQKLPKGVVYGNQYIFGLLEQI